MSPKVHAIACLSNAFRAPNIDDLGTLGIVDFRYEIPNTNLEPEKSVNLELGIKAKTKNFAGALSLYRNHLTNIFDPVRSGNDSIQGYQVYLKRNVAEAYIQGFEAETELKLSEHIFFRNNLTFTYGQNVSRNEPFRRIPPLYGLSGLTYRKQKGWINLDFIFATKQDRLASSDVDDNRIPDGGTPSWNILNMNVGYTLANWVTLSAGFNNILDEAYRTHGSGVDGYGRNFWTSLRFNINNSL